MHSGDNLDVTVMFLNGNFEPHFCYFKNATDACYTHNVIGACTGYNGMC